MATKKELKLLSQLNKLTEKEKLWGTEKELFDKLTKC
jgi:hypothetical protein